MKNKGGDMDGYDYQQLRHRDKHDGGVTWDKLKVTHARTKMERVRSKQDVRLFKAMDAQQEEAFIQIRTAHGIVNDGLGMKTQKFELGGKSTGDIMAGALLIAKYLRWKTYCKERYISPLMAEDVIVLGMSCNASEKERKMKHGAALTNLLACLDAWQKV